MIAASLSFLLLFGLVWVFERKTHNLEAFQIATVILVPLLVCAIFVAIRLMGLHGPAMQVATFLAFTAATFFVLFKILGIEKSRSLVYTGTVLICSIGASAMLPPAINI